MKDKKINTNNDEVTMQVNSKKMSPLSEDSLENVSGGQIYGIASDYVDDTDESNSLKKGRVSLLRGLNLINEIVEDCEEKLD